MPDKFDPYREALVMETCTHWPDDCVVEPRERAKIAAALHADPAHASSIAYVRMHTGFRREIAVMQADIDRVRG